MFSRNNFLAGKNDMQSLKTDISLACFNLNGTGIANAALLHCSADLGQRHADFYTLPAEDRAPRSHAGLLLSVAPSLGQFSDVGDGVLAGAE